MGASASGRRRRQAAVYITQADHHRLSALLGSSSPQSPGAALLKDEVERAIVVASSEFPRGFVKLDSTVVYEDAASGKSRRVQLVLPEAADIDENRISVFTPVGAALLGLRKGGEFDWLAADGRVRRLRIVEIEDAPRSDVSGELAAPAARSA